MEIKYSKFDFNIKDVYFFVFFLFGSNLFIYFYSVDFEEFLFSNTFFVYLGYRFYFVMKLKQKLSIKLENGMLIIDNKIYKKVINFKNIKKIIIRKNFLSSYDIIINFDETISLFRYLCNYFSDISIGKNHNISFVICDVINKDEVINRLLNELNIIENKEIQREKIVYVKYSLFEKKPVFLFLILSVLILIDIKILLFLYFCIINLRILKKKYKYIKIDEKTIKVEEKNKMIYVTEDFLEEESLLKIDYQTNNIFSKFNFYYFLYDVLPLKYKK